MKITKLALLLLAAGMLHAQIVNSPTGGGYPIPFNGAPTGSCGTIITAVDTTTGNFYSCNGGTWLKVGPGAAGSATLSSLTNATAANTISGNGTFAQAWKWALTGTTTAFNITENTAATGASNILFRVNTLSTSTALPVQFDSNGNGVQLTTAGLLTKIGTGALDATALSGVAPVANGGTGAATAGAYNFFGNFTNASAAPGFSVFGVNSQTGAGYTVVNGDFAKLVTVSNAAAQTLTLPATVPAAGWYIDAQNTGAGTWTLSPNGHNLDGAAGSITLTTGQGARIFTDGTNYFTQKGVGGGGGFTNPMTTLGDIIVENATPAAARLAGPTTPNGVPQYLTNTPSGGAAQLEAWALAGVLPNAQTGTTYTVAVTDRAGYISFSNAAAIAVTLPQAGSAGFGSNFATVACDIGAGTATITPTTSTISFSNGSVYTSGAASLALTTGQCATIYSDNTNYFAVVRAGSGGSSALSAITAAAGSNTIANGNNPQTWNWAQTTDSQDAFTFGETSAATNGTLTNALANQALLHVSTASASTETPVEIDQGSLTGTTGPAAFQIETTWNNASLVGEGILFNVTNTTSAAGSKLLDLRVGNTAQFTADKAGNAVALTSLQTTTTAPACTVGTAGFWCASEGTAFTNVASTAGIYPDSTAHEYLAKTNGASSAGMMVRAQPGSINQTAQTAAIGTATLCAAAAGACNVGGTYHVHFDFWGSGTACSAVTAGSVTFLLSWTDPNGTAHAAVALQMMSQTGAATTAMQASFPFQTALANEGAGGDFTFDTNGTVIQYATGYTACTTGTGTYNLSAVVTRLR